jgi:hypothetical protein
VRRFAALALVALGILSGVTANAADDPPPLSVLPPFCTGELQAANATVTSLHKYRHRVEIPGWLRCDTTQFAVADFRDAVGVIIPRYIKNTAPGGYTAFTFVQEVAYSGAVCLMPSVNPTMYAKNAVSCVRMPRNGDSVTVVQASPRDFQSMVPIEFKEDHSMPPAPECSNCW